MNRHHADDPGLAAVLHRFSIEPSALLGRGGEAWVYALDDERVLRVLHDPVVGGDVGNHSDPPDDIEARQALVDELATAEPPFALPQVLHRGLIEGRSYAIERRLPGRSVMDELPRLDRRERNALIEAHLDTAMALGDLHLENRQWFGDLLAPSPIRCPTWRSYLAAKAADGLSAAPGAPDDAPTATRMFSGFRSRWTTPRSWA